MNPYQWGRYFQEYGERTFEAGERWALRLQQPARSPTAASVRPVSAQVASGSQGSFWSGVKDGFGSTVSGMWGGLKYTVTHPLQAPKMIIDGFAHGIDSALEAENTPAYVQLRRLGHGAATMSAYDWGHMTGSTVANVGLFVVTDGAAGVVGRLASMTRGAGVLADVSIAADSVGAVAHPLAGVAARDVIDMAAARGLQTPRDSLVLWSGLGRDGVARSQAFAREFGGITLEMTPGGKWLDGMDLFGATSPFTRNEASMIWGEVSGRMVGQASGQVRSVLGQVRPDSVYRTYELPAMRENPAILGLDPLQVHPMLKASGY